MKRSHTQWHESFADFPPPYASQIFVGYAASEKLEFIARSPTFMRLRAVFAGKTGRKSILRYNSLLQIILCYDCFKAKLLRVMEGQVHKKCSWKLLPLSTVEKTACLSSPTVVGYHYQPFLLLCEMALQCCPCAVHNQGSPLFIAGVLSYALSISTALIIKLGFTKPMAELHLEERNSRPSRLSFQRIHLAVVQKVHQTLFD